MEKIYIYADFGYTADTGCWENIVCQMRGLETFLESRFTIQARQSEERVSVVTKLEQYTCTLFINYLTLLGVLLTNKVFFNQSRII